MPKYDDDQCVECGGIRVAKSKLCANCLVKAYERVNLQIAKADLRIIGMEKEVAWHREQMAVTLKYGFEKNQENAKLNRYVRELETRIAKNWEDQLW